MSLLKLKSSPFTLIQDRININILPLLETIQDGNNVLKILCYEQPLSYWKNVFQEKSNVIICEEFELSSLEQCSNKTSVIIDSANQMALCLGWKKSLQVIKKLLENPNITQLIVILHKDCLTQHSKLQINLNYMANAIVSYDGKNCNKVKIQLKKNGKLFISEEVLSYDNKIKVLKSAAITKEEKTDDMVDKPLPGNLSTFKIEVEQTEKLEKYKLKLPYMSKINEGESKVYYEPDAVDDWDEEDPDEDLDI